MKSRQDLLDLALRIHWAVDNGVLNEAVRILDELQQAAPAVTVASGNTPLIRVEQSPTVTGGNHEKI